MEGPQADSTQYFLISNQRHIPAAEVRRRQEIRSVLKAQFLSWRTSEYLSEVSGNGMVVKITNEPSWLVWDLPKGATRPSNRVSRSILSQDRKAHSPEEIATRKGVLRLLNIQDYFSADSFKKTAEQDFEDWIEDGANCYAIHIEDRYESCTRKYCLPLIDLVARPAISNSAFEDASLEQINSRIPDLNHGLRHIQFPQTRSLFLSDEVKPFRYGAQPLLTSTYQSFSKLYPLPPQTVRKLSHRLMLRFHGSPGLYNSVARPLFEKYSLSDYPDNDSIFICCYPFLEFENVEDYCGRKVSEELALQLCGRYSRDLPSISQWKYSRRFDLAEDIPAAVYVSPQEQRPVTIQSSRGLYESRFSSFSTLELDRAQSIVCQQQMEKSSQPLQLLVINSLWLVAFPGRGKGQLTLWRSLLSLC